MDHTIAEDPGGFLLFTCSGVYTFEGMKDFIGFARNISREKGYDKAIIDMTGVRGSMPDFDRFKLGELIADVVLNTEKLAIIQREEEINKFVENIASNRFVRILVTSNMDEAVSWIRM